MEEGEIVRPPYKDWLENLLANRERSKRVSQKIDLNLVSRARSEVVEAAGGDSSRLESSALVLSGHQPIFYHPGLLFKAEKLSSFARDTNSIGVSIILDTNEADGGEIAYPMRQGDDWAVGRVGIANGPGILAGQTIREKAEVEEAFSRIEAGLASCNLKSNSFKDTKSVFLKNVGKNLAETHSEARRAIENRSYHELTLSKFAVLPSVAELILKLLQNPKSFQSLYNSMLDSYRAQHKIENAANPFPNLKQDGEWLEIPVWSVDLKNFARTKVLARGEGRANFKTENGTELGALVPRGALVSLIFRIVSDFFIHGTGGGTYDPFTNEFAKALLGAELPSFAVASATRYLFPDKVREWNELSAVANQFKEIVSKPEKHFGKNLFSKSEEERIIEILKRKLDVLGKLQSTQDKAIKSELSRNVNACNQEIRSIVEEGKAGAALRYTEKNRQNITVWSYREFPAFLLENHIPL